MKKLIYPAILFSALSLVACGGGGSNDDNGGGGNNQNSGDSNTPDTAAPKLVSSPQTIDYYGDSTVYGWRTATEQVDTTAPEAFAAALPNSTTHTVTNKGFSGQTACELLEGTNLPRDWTAEMEQSAATVVILNHAINDAVSANSVSIDRYRGCLTSIAQIAENAGKRVVFETPNPIAEDATLVPYVEAMREIATAQDLSLIDQHRYLNQKYGGDASLITRDGDGLHPRDEIYIEKGQYAASVFADIPR